MPDLRRRSESRREELVAAAVRAIARNGYHGCRISDIAEEAGVSHGLVYHYFASKDEILETIFRENWGVVAVAIGQIAETDGNAIEEVRKIVSLMLHSWGRDPEVVRVLVREIARSPQLQERIGDFQPGFDALTRVIERGQRAGEIDPALDPRVATFAVWGMIDEVLTAWVLGRLPTEQQNVDAAEATVTALVRRALTA
ncbi:MAG TPA: TetR/AcrR family transcriptional regulator [Gaiellaceae bacterium]|nr:TetR/AcrR family transcriptional regulator [Gaiellaceae bacterium]